MIVLSCNNIIKRCLSVVRYIGNVLIPNEEIREDF